MNTQTKITPATVATPATATIKEANRFTVTSLDMVRRDSRIPAPCFKSKSGAKDSLRTVEVDGIENYRQVVGTSDSLKIVVTVPVAAIRNIDVAATVPVTLQAMSGYEGFEWIEETTINIPSETFIILGMFGIAERAQTNCRKKGRTAFYGICYALRNGGFNLSTVASYVSESAEERIAREKAEKAAELETFRALALKTKGISEKQKVWLRSMQPETLETNITGLLISTKWIGLLEAVNKHAWKHVNVSIPEVDNDLM